MFQALHIDLNEILLPVQQKLEADSFSLVQVNEQDLVAHLSSAELVIIGPAHNQPIKLVQAINGADKHISVIVLAMPAQFARVKQALQFAPFVGKNSLCIAYTPNLDIASACKQAALRTRQRRSFSKININPAPVASIASSAVKVEDFGIFLEQAPVGALLVDENQNIIAFNLKAREIFSVDHQKHPALTDLFPNLSLQQLKLSLGANATKVVQAHNLYLELNIAEVKNEEGKALNIILLNDITEQKKKEAALVESEALFRFMAEAMPQKVWTADANGDLNFFNQHWTTYTGKTMEELKGWGWISSIHPDDAEQNREVWQHAIDTGTDFQFEQRIQQYNNEYRWHLVRGVAKKDAAGKVTMWIGTNTDIHEQKAFAEELERRIKERTFELEKSNSELEQFVYVTSHDLQEPLRKIRMFSDILQSTNLSMDAAAARQLEKINATALRMSTLLQELLNFTQMSKEEQLQEIDLNEIVARALVDLELVVSQKNAVIEVGDLPVLRAIPVQMHQLFYNLLNNALKFSKPGIAPEVKVTGKVAGIETLAKHPQLLHDVEYYEIIVADNGIGFSQEFAEQIFNIFQRLHNRSEYSGTGIGLALCKKVVTNHYGIIYAVSEENKGASFHILLPKFHRQD
ncbi:sensor histidine kinase [Aridibaculum aurantiacum]|uniref:sensor histidine kinase n=1 Tax=Aridibaculum aurantiacum TaxID=2810307 RepID=UPI001A96540A|nr:PAS domain-containing sensor histidine kinase [Aridibaculum aurantiacum]